jgi:hypothetical protein
MRTSVSAIGLLTMVMIPVAIAHTRPESAPLPQAKKLEVFLAQGHKALSILDEPRYRRVLGDIFKAHITKFDDKSPSAAFLQKFFASDIVYLSLHSNPREWVIGSGETINLDDMSVAYRRSGRAPAVIVVTGCNTLGVAKGARSFPEVLGITTRSTKHAYIGFREEIEGYWADRFFRVFFAAWTNPRAPGQYLTLQEAKLWARNFIETRLAQQNANDNGDRITTFFKEDPKVADRLVIIGAPNMKITDLVR